MEHTRSSWHIYPFQLSFTAHFDFSRVFVNISCACTTHLISAACLTHASFLFRRSLRLPASGLIHFLRLYTLYHFRRMLHTYFFSLSSFTLASREYSQTFPAPIHFVSLRRMLPHTSFLFRRLL